MVEDSALKHKAQEAAPGTPWTTALNYEKYVKKGNIKSHSQDKNQNVVKDFRL